MAAAPQKQVLEVIKARVMNIDKRYNGYQDDLIVTLYKILEIVRDPPHDITQQISRNVSKLGEKLIQKEGNME